MFAFYDRVNSDLMVGRCLNAACSDATYSVVDSAGDVGRYASITPGTSATLGPVISLRGHDEPPAEAGALRRSGLRRGDQPWWSRPTSAPGTAPASSSAFNGRPLVGYLRRLESDGPGGVWAAHCENSDCSSITTTFLSAALYDRGIGASDSAATDSG